MTHDDWAREQALRVEDALSQWVPEQAPAGLGEAMRYAVLDGGKRLRPMLVLAAAEAVGGHPGAALRAACSVELIHAYSLVHDDLPCMDNDVLRRGKPTVHVRYGVAQAMLVGDGLQALAFDLLACDDPDIPDAVKVSLCRWLARASGVWGMVGGQAIDIAQIGHAMEEAQLREMHRLKTGALLLSSVMMGAACGATDERARQALTRYGEALGVAFQVIDDVLDVVADAATLGKTVGKDAANDKPTFVSLLGLDGARAHARTLHGEALAALDDSGLRANLTLNLQALADKVVNRDH